MKYGVMSTRNLSGRRQAVALLVGEVEDLLDLVEVVDAVRELPAPVVPLARRARPPTAGRAPADGRLAVGPKGPRRVARVDEGLRGGRLGGSSVRRCLDLLLVQGALTMRRVHKFYAVCMIVAAPTTGPLASRAGRPAHLPPGPSALVRLLPSAPTVGRLV